MGHMHFVTTSMEGDNKRDLTAFKEKIFANLSYE